MYIVKSINLNNAGVDVVLNLKLFNTHEKAEAFMREVEKQIPIESDAEWLEIESITLESV